MGEAKRKQKYYDTFDGGPPSDDKITMELVIFSPGQFLLEMDTLPLADQEQRAQHIYMTSRRISDRTKLKVQCSCCEHEFDYNEAPALLAYLKPWIQNGPIKNLYGGAICEACAELPYE
jgi:hypothetical protein